MEWIIGLIVIYFIWRIFFAKGSTEFLIKDEILKIYRDFPNEVVDSSLYYDDYLQYAKNRDVQENNWGNGNKSFTIFHNLHNGKKIAISITRNTMNNKAFIQISDEDKYYEKANDLFNKIKKDY